jgi:hypothetical protein
VLGREDRHPVADACRATNLPADELSKAGLPYNARTMETFEGGGTSRVALAGRLLLLAVLAVWSLAFFRRPLGSLGDSVLHLIDLVFHEAGHIVFAPFGRFLTALGGSLMQVLVPLVCAAALLFRTRDAFGAAVCLWWGGQNLLDLAPYIDDARALQLVLLGGQTGAGVEGHDWEAILAQLGWLHLDHALARDARLVGSLVMVGALAWAAVALWRQRMRAANVTPSVRSR